MIKIFTYAFNNPKYLEYQIRAFKKFMVDPFEFYCIDNSKDPNISQELRQICINNNIKYEPNKSPNHITDGISHYSALQWSYNTLMANQNNICVLIDHDMFPIKPISILEILDGASIAGAPQSRGHVNYLHPSLIILKLNEMTNENTLSFNCSIIEGQKTDTGGEFHNYFKNNPNVKVKLLPAFLINDSNNNMNLIPQECHSNYNRNYLFEIVDNKFMHTRLGSNWIDIEKTEFKKRDDLIYYILDKYYEQA